MGKGYDGSLTFQLRNFYFVNLTLHHCNNITYFILNFEHGGIIKTTVTTWHQCYEIILGVSITIILRLVVDFININILAHFLNKEHTLCANHLTTIESKKRFLVRWNVPSFFTWCTKFGEIEFYRAFHRFGQAKFPDGGSVLGSSQFSILPQLPLKTMLGLKVVKIDSKIRNSLH